MQVTEYLVFSGIEPVAFQIGALAVHWYAIMYILGFVIAAYLAYRRLPRTCWSSHQLNDLLFWCCVGVIIGGRAGYVLFYQFTLFTQEPLYLLNVSYGGMSFHGGLIGVLSTLYWRAKHMHTHFLALADFIAPLVPLGLGAGHIGHFINAELWGRASKVPWAIVFPDAGSEPRHPSQLYEFAFEGLLLFVVLWLYSAAPRRTGAVTGLFLIGYGLFRIIIEFFREPDAHLGVNIIQLTHGQMLCLPMLLVGVYLLMHSRNYSISEGAGVIPK